MKLEFKANKPCSDCPYRKDAPLKLWHKSEYKKLADNENNFMGTVYGCHKQNGCVCVGWLMMQDQRRFPSMNLRIKLSRESVTREYLDSLSSPSQLYGSTEEMIKTNYPDL